MRLVTFSHNGVSGIGLAVSWRGESRLLDLHDAAPSSPTNMLDFLALGEPGMALAREVIASAQERWLIPAAEAKLLAPVPRPGKILCLGHNYYDHMEQGRTQPAEYPTFFCKTVNTVIGPDQPIIVPRASSQVDYEAELAVVIGQRARHVSESDAYGLVAGYTIFNDVSARDYQNRTSQWMMGKSFDTFGPMGPALVTADEVPDPHQLELRLTLNEREMQRSNTGNMIFRIPYLIACLSEVMTLEPGDIISTGTPAKTELAHNVPPFMKAGDLVTIYIDKLGELSNPLAAEG